MQHPFKQPPERFNFAQHILETGSPEYQEQFQAYLENPQREAQRTALSLTNVLYCFFGVLMFSAFLVLVMQFFGMRTFPYILRTPVCYLYAAILAILRARNSSSRANGSAGSGSLLWCTGGFTK